MATSPEKGKPDMASLSGDAAPAGVKQSSTFTVRVDYICKAIVRGKWGPVFEGYISDHDSDYIVTAILNRAERNDALKAGILRAFDVTDWELVPWHQQAARLRGVPRAKLVKMADEALEMGRASMAALYADAGQMLAGVSDETSN